MVVPACPGYVVSRIKYNKTCFVFWKFLRLRNWVLDFFFFWGGGGGGLIFGPGIFCVSLESPRDLLGGFDFCPHSIIPVTCNPEYIISPWNHICMHPDKI